MKKCDLCENEVKELISLKEIYRIDGISEICEDCNQRLNKKFYKIQDFSLNITRTSFNQFLKACKKKFRKKDII